MQLRDVMTTDPVICDIGSSLTEAASKMREHNIGDVLVSDGDGSVCGIVTDRDLVVRGLAEGDVSQLTLGDVCDGQLQSVDIDASTDEAIELMESAALRRVPVMDDGKVAGIVSLGDLARRLDRESALGAISDAPPDR